MTHTADAPTHAALMEGARVLGVETSCDETAASVVAVEGGVLRVLSNAVATQHAVHEPFAGVVPELASRAHIERLLPVLRAAMTDAGCSLGDLHAVAVGHRPGLIGSLLVGTAAAKALAWSRGVPFLGVDHVAAHLVAAFLDRPVPAWPALGLVVSGGHTHLAWVESPSRARVVGQTIDDAVGEAFDKAAVMLGFGYPGGPQLDAASDGGNDRAIALPQPTLTAASTARTPDPVRTPELDFSFSGLKTALLYAVRGVPAAPRQRMPPPPVPPLTPERVRDLAATFQRAAVQQIVDRTERALMTHPARTLLVGGGVAANRLLRAELTALAQRRRVELLLPTRAYCIDNAAMIAGLAHFRLAAGECDPLSLAPQPRSALAARRRPCGP